MRVGLLVVVLAHSGIGILVPYLIAARATSDNHAYVLALLFWTIGDDIVLTVSSRFGLQEPLDVYTRHGDRLRQRFSAQKCVVLRWGSLGGRTEREPVTLQRKDIPFAHSYRYLGIQLSTGPHYIWRTMRTGALSASRHMRVFGEAVKQGGKVGPRSSQDDPERGGSGKRRATASRASFEAREGVAKLSVEVRTWILGEKRWAHQTQKCLLYTGAATRWTRRVRVLSTKYGVATVGDRQAGGDEHGME
ncbi:hypothetical protein HPB47_002292 [Ixodes persulcatus]|uniref:Uncharacterized protein n=1 Tax=Ixodes persulcatus TaxID=34615 RepID=A0AC60PN82_IXOPE|nr:hypothetical protein HPB47_002292 [Ixodes persulcatus]